jgi:hypothetical protein
MSAHYRLDSMEDVLLSDAFSGALGRGESEGLVTLGMVEGSASSSVSSG